MVVIVSKNRIAMFLFIFLLSITLYSYNINKTESLLTSGNISGKKIIVIDAGHGGEDPGAVSDYSGLKEKDVNLRIAQTLKLTLEKENYEIIMTRDDDVLEYTSGLTNIVKKRQEDLNRRKKIMDESNADIVVSIHLNKFPQNKYHGAQVFYPQNSLESKRLAMSIQECIRVELDPNNNREALVKEENIIILKNYMKPTVIVECGFLSNEEEEKLLGDEEYQTKIANVISMGINKYFEN